MPFQKHPNLKLLLSTLIPVLAALVQWHLWPIVAPKTWIFLYPAVFFSASIGGLVGGTLATCITALLGVYFFIHPEFTWVIGEANNYVSLFIFVSMGLLFSLTFDRFHRTAKELQRLSNIDKEVQQSRLKQALDASNAGIWEWNTVTNENVWTESLWRLFGLEPYSCQASYDLWLSTVYIDDQTNIEEAIKYAVENRSVLNIEWRLAQSFDDKIHWLMSRGQPELNNQGEAVLYRGIVLDISERKEIEKKLQENEERLNFALETLKCGAWELNLNSHRAQRTSLHDQIFGYTTLLPEWTYEIFLEHVIPEDREAVNTCFGQAITNQTDWSFECRIRRADGSIRWISAKGGHKFDKSGKPIALAGIVQDITEAKENDARQRYTETRYRTFVDQAAPDGLFVHNHNGDFIEVNRQACQSVGYSKEELLTMNVLDLEQDFDLALAQAEWGRILPGENKILTGHHRHKDGHQFPVEVHFGLLIFEGQRLYIALVRDITASMLMAAELHRWADAFQFCGHGLVIGNPDTQCIQTCNPAFAKMMGIDNVKDLEGKAILSLYPAEQVEKAKANIQYADEYGSINFDSKYQRADGSQFDVNINLVSIKNTENRVLYRVATVQDITERKKSDTIIKESAARTQAILDTVVDGIITIDKLGIIETFNPAAERIFGYNADEVISRNLNMLMPEPYSKAHDSYLNNYLSGGPAKIIGIGRVVEGRRKNGSTFPLDLAVSETQLGEKCIFTGIVRDITERQFANEKLKAALNEKEILLKEVYHRVKNNLQVVSSLINLQARHVKNEEALNLLKQSADRIKAMALLHEKLYQSKDLAKIDFNAYVGSLIDSLLYSFGSHANRISIKTHIKDIFLDIDTAIPCGLIINELLSNAIQHAFPNSQQGVIEIGFTREQHEFKLVISDNGIGLPDGLNIKKCKSLGLQLVARLANDQLRGRMSIDENSKTSFTIHFANAS